MKTLWIAVVLALILAGTPASWGTRRQLRRRVNVPRAANRRSTIIRRLPSQLPPRCYTDVTRPEAVDEYEAKIKSAPYVLTGKVTRILEHGRELQSIQVDANGVALDDNDKVLQLRIKRALKGEFPWDMMEVELTKPHTHKSVEVFVRGGLQESNRVLEGEDGVGRRESEDAGTRCRHVLRQNHTAIFLARREDAVHRGDVFLLQLAANPLALTLRNLDKVNAAVKGMSCRYYLVY